MIHVNRPSTAVPPEWKAKAEAETSKAIAAYRDALKKLKTSSTKEGEVKYAFEFKVYGDDLLRAALNEQYKYKCAYCETFYGATQPVAVEHYRPKGEILEGNVRVQPGYYWLAATGD